MSGFFEIRLEQCEDPAPAKRFAQRHGGKAIYDSPTGVIGRMAARDSLYQLVGYRPNGARRLIGIGGHLSHVYAHGPGGRICEPIRVEAIRQLVIHRDHRRQELGAFLASQIMLMAHLKERGRVECVVAALTSGDASAADMVIRRDLGIVTVDDYYALSVSPGLRQYAVDMVTAALDMPFSTHIAFFRHDVLRQAALVASKACEGGYRLAGAPVFNPVLATMDETAKRDYSGLVHADPDVEKRYGLRPDEQSSGQSITGRYSQWLAA